MSTLRPWIVLLLLTACGDDGGSGPETTFGDGTTSMPMTTTAATGSTGDDEPTAGTGSATSAGTTSEPPGTTSQGEGTTAGDSATTAGDAASESSGDPKGAHLSDCAGTGAWDNCDQVCAGEGSTCVEQGCDGNTVEYYDDIGACVDVVSDDSGQGACGDDFAMGGGISFARCCCV